MLVLGLMSGTSADGIDIALCDIHNTGDTFNADIIAGHTYPYTPELRQGILDNCDRASSRVDEISQLSFDLAETFSNAIHEFSKQYNINLDDVDLIGSHGHTLWHSVQDDGSVSATFQIGEGAVIAERTGITTINNMRARDVACGGQGAPLTGYVDWLLLRHSEKWRAVQNIGGMGNVTFLPPLNEKNLRPIAFDTGPGNALIDVAVAYFTNGQQQYDKDSKLAQEGRIDEVWLDDLLQHPYYQRDYPKTTGREMFGTEAALALIDDAQQRGLSQNEIIATLTALTATNIVDAYKRFAPAPISEIILGGGGKHNPMIVGMMSELLAPANVMTHEDIGISSDFKEALVFAILAYETWHGRVGTLPSLTGADHAAILGQIIPAKNYDTLLRKRMENLR